MERERERESGPHTDVEAEGESESGGKVCEKDDMEDYMYSIQRVSNHEEYICRERERDL